MIVLVFTKRCREQSNRDYQNRIQTIMEKKKLGKTMVVSAENTFIRVRIKNCERFRAGKAMDFH